MPGLIATYNMDLPDTNRLPVPDTPDTEEAQADPQKLESHDFDSLENYVQRAFREARDHKDNHNVKTRLDKCLRQYKGEYEPDLLQAIQAMGGTDLYRKLTMIKSDGAAAWLKDLLLPDDDGTRPWKLDPTEKPDLPPEVIQRIVESTTSDVMREMQAAQQQGSPLSQQDWQKIALQVAAQRREQTEKMQNKEARTRADRMSEIIEDQQQQGNYREAMEGFIEDYVVYPNAFLKGPYVSIEQQLSWQADGTASVEDKPALEWKAVSPYDMFPAPDARTSQDGYMIETGEITRADLYALKEVKGYSTEAIDRILEEVDPTGTAPVRSENLDVDTHDATRDDLQGYDDDASITNKLKALEFWGPVQGKLLKDWGLEVEDGLKDYQVMVHMVAGEIIKAMVNPDPAGRIPYSTDSYKTVRGSFWGMSLPETMEDVQRGCNAAIRALCNNVALSSGPQTTVDVAQLPDGATPQKPQPWAVHQVDSSRSPGGARTPVQFSYPQSIADSTLKVYNNFKAEADDVTGIPAYATGNVEEGGAADTATGLRILQDNATKGIRRVLKRIASKVIADSIKRQYAWNMRYHPDKQAKGDLNVNIGGILTVLAKQDASAKRLNWLNMTNNPTDMKIIGIRRRANVLRKEAGEALDMEPDDVVPPDEQMQQVEQMMMQQAQMGAQNPEGGQEQPGQQQQQSQQQRQVA